MAIVEDIRITSGTQTQTDSETREDAIIKAINKQIQSGPIQDSIVVGNLPSGIWPILEAYRNDNSAESITFSNVIPPQFIWDDAVTAAGETRYFAEVLELDPVDEYTISILTFADDAHRLFVEERTIDGELVQSFSPPAGLIDGSLEPDSGNISPPFNWQRIRFWSSDDIIIQSSENFIVISWQVVNYDPIGSVNPAGLAFVVDVYSVFS